jgi:hypothetical protein
MSMVKGGSSANLLVKGMATEWGRKLYGRTLLSNIAQSIYKDRDAIVKGLRDSVKQQARRATGREEGEGWRPGAPRRTGDTLGGGQGQERRGRAATPSAAPKLTPRALKRAHSLRACPLSPPPQRCAWVPPRPWSPSSTCPPPTLSSPSRSGWGGAGRGGGGRDGGKEAGGGRAAWGVGV